MFQYKIPPFPNKNPPHIPQKFLYPFTDSVISEIPLKSTRHLFLPSSPSLPFKDIPTLFLLSNKSPASRKM